MTGTAASGIPVPVSPAAPLPVAASTARRAHPVIYEINTWPWLNELSRAAGRPVTLGSVPDRCWEELATLGVDAVWLMGVWQRSPAGIAIALDNPDLTADFDAALPDWQPEDVVGSPYCVRNYVVDDHLGGPDGLAAARAELAARGIGLILDFVPNHVAPDHPWVTDRPELFVAGTRRRPERRPALVPADRRPGRWPTAATRTSRPGRTSCSSTCSSRGCGRP